MDNTNREIYKQLLQYATEIFSQLRNLDVRTYTTADLSKYTARSRSKSKAGEWVCKKPEAMRFRHALDVYQEMYVKEHDSTEITIRQDNFECSFQPFEIFDILYSFERLAQIPKSESVTFTYSDTAGTKQIAYLTLVLPKNAAQVEKCINPKDYDHPSMRYFWIDTSVNWMWCTETHVLYAHPINGKLHNVHEDWKEFKQWPITMEMAKKYAGQEVCVQYFDNGTIICRKVNYDEVTAKVEHLNSLMKRVPAWRRVIPDIDPATRIVLDMDHFDKFKKFLSIYKKSEFVGLEIAPAEAQLIMTDIKEGNELGDTQRCDTKDSIEHQLKGAYNNSLLSAVSKDMNGVMYHGGKSRSIIIESKDGEGFYLLAPANINADYFKDYTETHKPNINYMATKIETPMMKAYQEKKAKFPDSILLFRVGDFYETMNDDAVAISEILGITLTRRSYGAKGYVELAGFPHHALDTYLPKLVRAGKRVAICESLNDGIKATEVKTEETATATDAETEGATAGEAEAKAATTTAETAETAETGEAPAETETETETPAETPAETQVGQESNPPTKHEQMKAALLAAAGMQLDSAMSIVGNDFTPIGEDNGKLRLIVKDNSMGKYRYADIVAVAQFLYVNERKFDTAEEIAELMGMDLGKPKPAPEPVRDATQEELVELFMSDHYGMDGVAAAAQALMVVGLVNEMHARNSVEFSFRKKDGSLRFAHGTLMPEYMPEAKGTGRPLDMKLQLYYDLDKQALRSFEKARLVSFIS